MALRPLLDLAVLQVEPALELGDLDITEAGGDGGGKLVPELLLKPLVRGEVARVLAQDARGVRRGGVQRPELGELARPHEVVQLLQERHRLQERLVLRVDVREDRARLTQKRKAQVEVRSVDRRGERLDQDVEDDVRVRELGVELVPVELAWNRFVKLDQVQGKVPTPSAEEGPQSRAVRERRTSPLRADRAAPITPSTGLDSQLEDGEVGEEVVLSGLDLLGKVILHEAEVGRVIPV